MNPLVSVIIPMAKGSHFIDRCLDSIYAQTYQDIEVIAIGKPNAEQKDTRSQQRNRGILAAKGKYVFPVDSDHLVEPEVVERAVGVCERGEWDFLAVVSNAPPPKTVVQKVRAIEWQVLGEAKFHLAVNFARREDMMRAGLYREDQYAAEEYDLHNRMLALGLRFGVLEGAHTIHLGEPEHLRELVSKNVHYGKNAGSYLSKNGVGQIQPFRLAYLRAVPRFGLLFFPFVVYKAVQYLSAGIGLILAR